MFTITYRIAGVGMNENPLEVTHVNTIKDRFRERPSSS